MFSVSTRWCAIALFAGFAVAPSFAREVATDGWPERPALVQKVRSLFVAEVFATLEKTAQEERKGARFTDGCWQLVWFYNAFAPPTNATEAQWEDWLKRFDRWDQAYPESITARIARAQAWMAWAGSKRQRGQPDAADFFARTDEVRNVLEANPAAKTCPGYFLITMELAVAQDWSREEYEKLFSAAVALAPDCEEFYFRKARWMDTHSRDYDGSWGPPWVHFAEESAARTSKSMGMGMYTRIVWAMLGHSGSGTAMDKVRLNAMSPREVGDLQRAANADPNPATGALLALVRMTANQSALKIFRVDWEKMRRGFEDLEKQFPQSVWNKNAFCFYAFCANDRETTRRLLVELKGRFAPEVWPGGDYFEKVNAWAGVEEAVTPQMAPKP